MTTSDKSQHAEFLKLMDQLHFNDTAVFSHESREALALAGQDMLHLLLTWKARTGGTQRTAWHVVTCRCCYVAEFESESPY